MKKNNNGFSLVELIIVIAIMAVLIGLLAPQYLRFVEKTKKAADVQNAQAISTAYNVAFADGKVSAGTYGGNGGAACAESAAVGIANWSEGKSVPANSAWSVVVGSDGVSNITLDSKNIWPTPDTAFAQ